MTDHEWKNQFVRASGGKSYDANVTYRFPNGHEVPQECALRDLFDAAFGIDRQPGECHIG